MPTPGEIERIKLRATAYNNLAVGGMLAGALTPFVSILLQIPTFQNVQGPVFALMAVSLLLVCYTLHWMGQAVLRRIDQ